MARKVSLLSSVGPARWTVRTLDWLPVVVDGKRTRIGLEQALMEAHRIERLDIEAPLARAGVIWFLAATTALVIREARIAPSVVRELPARGLPAEAVGATLDRLDDRLWLVHPDRPFLQEARYAASEPNRQAIAIDPSLPGPSTKLWFGSNLERRALSPQDAVLALLVYWFFSPNSNSRPKIEGEEVRSAGSVIGSSAFNSGIRAFATGGTLLEAILRNTLRAWVDSPLDPCFLRDVTSPHIVDPFDVATASGNAVLLFREDEDGPFTEAVAGGALRTGIPMTADIRARRAAHSRLREDRDAEIKAAKARNAERRRTGRGRPGGIELEQVPVPLEPFDSPYDVVFNGLKDVALDAPSLVRIRRLGKDGAEDPAQQPRPLTGFTFGQRLFDDLEAVFRDRRVVMPASSEHVLPFGRIRHEFFEVTYRSATTPLFESAEWHAAGAELLELETADRNALRPFAERLVADRSAVRVAIRMALGGNEKASAIPAIVEAAEEIIAADLAPLLSEAIDAVQRGEDVPRELHERAARAILDGAKAALRPYESVSRMADIAHACGYLAGKLRRSERDGPVPAAAPTVEGTAP